MTKDTKGGKPLRKDEALTGDCLNVFVLHLYHPNRECDSVYKIRFSNL